MTSDWSVLVCEIVLNNEVPEYLKALGVNSGTAHEEDHKLCVEVMIQEKRKE